MDLIKVNETSKKAANSLEEMQQPPSEEVLDYNRYLEGHKETIKRLELEASNKDKELGRLRKELEEMVERAREEKQELEAEWQTKLQLKLSERGKELDEEWSMKMQSAVLELQQELERLEDDKRNHQNTLEQLNISGDQVLPRLLANALTGEDIPSDLLYQLLPKTFSSIDKFAFQSTDGYVFAEVYTGCQDIFQVANDDLRMVDLLYWMKGVSFSSRIHLDASSWLEHHFLKQIRSLQKGETWVLLAHSLLSNLSLSADWPMCCIAMVRLAVLSNQYPMRDTHEWNKFVTGLMDNYKELDDDPLAQACFAYLSLTTSDPRATMARNLPESLSQADFDITTRIPELLSKLANESQDVAQGVSDNSIAIIIARRRHQDVIFAKFTNGWSFSLEPINLSLPQDKHRRYTHWTLKWGERPEQTADVMIGSSMSRYISRHHGALAARATEDLGSELDAELTAMEERLRQPLPVFRGS